MSLIILSLSSYPYSSCPVSMSSSVFCLVFAFKSCPVSFIGQRNILSLCLSGLVNVSGIVPTIFVSPCCPCSIIQKLHVFSLVCSISPILCCLVSGPHGSLVLSQIVLSLRVVA